MGRRESTFFVYIKNIFYAHLIFFPHPWLFFIRTFYLEYVLNIFQIHGFYFLEEFYALKIWTKINNHTCTLFCCWVKHARSWNQHSTGTEWQPIWHMYKGMLARTYSKTCSKMYFRKMLVMYLKNVQCAETKFPRLYKKCTVSIKKVYMYLKI